MKTDKNNISALNKNYNQEVINEYGNIFGNPIEKPGTINEKSNSNTFDKIKKEKPKNTNALASLFTSINDPKNPSPSKVFMFKVRKEK